MNKDSKPDVVEGYRKYLTLCEEKKETLQIQQESIVRAKWHMERTFGQWVSQLSSLSEDASASDIHAQGSSCVNMPEDPWNPIESLDAIEVAVRRFFANSGNSYLSQINIQDKDYSHISTGNDPNVAYQRFIAEGAFGKVSQVKYQVASKKLTLDVQQVGQPGL